MSKKLSRTEMLMTLGFLFMLVCAVGSFFVGYRVGSDRTTANFEAQKQLESKPTTTGTFQQQDLVSFYHTIFMPYREFQNEWLTAMDRANTKQTSDFPTEFKRLSTLAQQKFNEISSVSTQHATLLEQSQQQLLKSLASFQSVSKRLSGNNDDASVAQLMTALKKDSDYKAAVAKSLQGHQSYYEAMLKWSATIDADIPSAIKMPNSLSISEWKKMPLIVKNKLSADLVASAGKVVGYYPQDLTSRIDEFINSGQANKLNMRLIGPIAELLADTKAVRGGDFQNSMGRLYANQLLPQLPFFLPEDK
ncbi:conserved hypothetical protein [Paenibacillus curdlanolyticus YK9]|uniref:Uncharacterized protein n=1 Tax=Paenibacillus curdlanolyticus YK9 TaxID=717606 RepID=E0ICC2_9BACL|nr:hypothetical protein [Paenibacillus curdlanolyticus]EFM09808.1 conserved hypothetical protein [Paenibacillus curdlanolyticus YK9]